MTSANSLWALRVALPSVLCIAIGSASADEERPSGQEPESSGETIVIVQGARNTGVRDLQGSETEHVDAERGLEDSAFVTTVHVADSEGESRTVSEVLARTVGVNARSLGGLGAFSSISVRGSAPGHTSVAVDGIPLSRIVSVGANLGTFELGSFETIELFRGGVPPRLGGAGVGGAVNMQTALGRNEGEKSFTLSLGTGSFGARHLRTRWLGGKRKGKKAAQVSVGYAGASGDFEFFDNRNTRLNFSDDRVSTRKNNSFDRFDVLARARLGNWTLGSRSSLQAQGQPGSSSNPALEASLSTANELLDLRYDRPDYWGEQSHASVRTFASVERQHFSDPESEIGLLAQNSVYLTTSLGLGAGTQLRLGQHSLSADIDSRMDWFRDRTDSDNDRPKASGNRQGLRLALSEEAEIIDGSLFAEFGVRADLLRTLPSRDVFSQGSSASAPEQKDWYLSPRATLRYRVAESIALKASGGRYLRIPTLVEMFGDRGFILGNPELRPEIGLTGDFGIVWAPWQAKSIVDRIYIEAAAFVSRPKNPIVFLTGNGFVSQARNLDGARILGTEFVASARFWKRVTTSANYSVLDARKRSNDLSNDKLLPGRPENRVYARVDTAFQPGGRLLVLWADALYVSGNYLDELNSLELPSRTLLGCGIKAALVRDLILSLEVKNLLDLRSEEVALHPSPSPDVNSTPLPLSDVHGFPLPGRSIYLNLQWAL